MIEERFPGHPYLPYLLVLPSLAVIVIFLIYPFAESVWGSFYITSFFGNKKVFVGLENYIELFRSPDYLQSVVVTLYFSAFVVVVGLAASLGIALLLNQRIGGLGLYQILLVWTYSISPAVAGVIWALLFAPATGLVPWLAGLLVPGYTLNWMTNGPLALFVVSLAATWKMLGYNIVFFLAGLQNIPEELIDAARVDGAGPWLSFRYITLPMLSPTTTFLLFMNMLYAFFQVFGLIDIMTQGGPGDATNVLVYNLYRDAFIHLDSGRANAQSVIIFIVIAIAAMLQLRVATRKAVYAR
ncbi:sugar ABC transporter permease [Oceanithermus sp.]|uniref:carbohydrate ABC transporter permease n=1 Tax=Oceanithermus sp. TaxID=2268145 RepID=UPI00257C8EC6|nr:sugar ABC transporter permease [Oceanithermus sp.]